MFKISSRLTAFAAIAAFMALSAPQAWAQATYTFDLPAQPLAEALRAVGHQTSTNVMFEPKLVKNLRAPALREQATTAEAIRRLLGDAKLTAVQTAPDSILIQAVSADSSEASAKAVDRKSGAVQSVSGDTVVAQAGTSALSKGEGEGEGEDRQRPSGSSASSEAEKNKISEIVVTAQKRAEKLQDVPISISVLSGKELDSSTFSGVTEAFRSVPGFDTNTDAYMGGTILSVRGVATGEPRDAGVGPSAYYIDGVPYGFVRSAIYPADPSIYDLHRIEVLRGPQGTLYGANALNGVVRILTQDAALDQFDFKARTSISGTSGGGENYRGDVAINVPIIEGKLAVRGVVGYQNDSGWIDSFYPNPYPTNPSLAGTHFRSDVNDVEAKNYRLKIRAQPTDTLSIDLSAWRSQRDTSAPSLANDDAKTISLQGESGSQEFTTYGLKVNKDFSAFSVSSMTSYIDFSGAGIKDGSPVGFPGVLDQSYASKVFSQEVNLISNLDGPWRWTAGAFYRDATDDKDSGIIWLPPFASRGTTLADNYTDTSESAAVYGELGRRFFHDTMALSFGLRYFRDEGSTVSVPLGFPTPAESVSKAVTPRAVLTWTPTSDRTAYVSYAKGFRSGFAQAPTSLRQFPGIPDVDPDSLTNYEIGAKGSLLDGRISYEAAAFYIDWKDVQVAAGYLGTTGLGYSAVVNGQAASGPGAEFALTARPLAGLELGANVSWNDLTADGDVLGLTTVILSDGDRLPFSPEYTAGGSARYSFPLRGSGLTGQLSLSANYKSAQATASLNATTRDSDTMLIARTSFSVEAPSHWTATIYADNINNEKGSPDPGEDARLLFGSTRIRPRTIGVQLEYYFK